MTGSPTGNGRLPHKMAQLGLGAGARLRHTDMAKPFTVAPRTIIIRNRPDFFPVGTLTAGSFCFWWLWTSAEQT